MPPKKRSSTSSSDQIIGTEPKKSTTGRGRKNESISSTSLQTSSSSISKVGSIDGTKETKDSSTLLKSNDIDIEKNIDEHPLRINDFIILKYRDNSYRVAQIIEKSLQEDENNSTKEYHYYIHYLDFNRRMDEWITPDRILNYPSIANKYGKKILKIQKKAHEKLIKIKEIINNKDKKKDTTINIIEKDKEEDNDIDSETELTDLPYSSELLSNSSNSSTYTNISEFDHDEHEGLDETSLIEHEKLTKIKNIQTVQLGKYKMHCWYFSPFPLEYYNKSYIKCLYFCQYTMRFFKTKDELIRFQCCKLNNYNKYPPGIEIYRDSHLSMFEIDGALEKFYCQNLSYFAKLFLDHKTLYWDVDPFLFYVLCTRDDKGYHPVGYFSKEKYSDLGYNLACILAFPCIQRQGYGSFLIDFSYLLSKKEQKVGSPEKPLSDLGALGYRTYWSSVILHFLQDHLKSNSTVSIMDITTATSILPEDVINTLDMLGILICDEQDSDETNEKQEESQNLTSTSKRPQAPRVKPFRLYLPNGYLSELIKKYPLPKRRTDPSCLKWTPPYAQADPKKDKWSLIATLTAARAQSAASGNFSLFSNLLNNNVNNSEK